MNQDRILETLINENEFFIKTTYKNQIIYNMRQNIHKAVS